MGSCSSNHEADGGNQGFHPDHPNGGFNPGTDGNESHRPHSRQAGNMAPNLADPTNPENQAAAAPQADNAEEAKAQAMGDLANTAMGALASPVMGGMQPPAPQMEMPPQGAPQQPAGPQGRPWIDFDPRTNKPMLRADGQLGQAAAGGFQEMSAPEPVHEMLPPQAGQPYGNHLIIGAVSADVSGGHIVQEGHWEEFDAANNVMLLEDFEKTLRVD